MGPIEELPGFERFEFERDGRRKPVYRRGQGPGVILMHELPGMSPSCVELGRWIASAGFDVYLPLFFGTPEETGGALRVASFAWCIRKEFSLLRAGRTSPIIGWLRGLAQEVRRRTGHETVGAIGMCLTGGFALAMLLEDCVAAPVLSQPSLPLALPWNASVQRFDLGLDDEDLACVKKRVASERIPILGFRFQGDRISPPERFQRLEREFPETFRANRVPGDHHSVLTIHFHHLNEAERQAVWTTLVTFLNERLKGGDGWVPPSPWRAGLGTSVAELESPGER